MEKLKIADLVLHFRGERARARDGDGGVKGLGLTRGSSSVTEFDAGVVDDDLAIADGGGVVAVDAEAEGAAFGFVGAMQRAKPLDGSGVGLLPGDLHGRAAATFGFFVGHAGRIPVIGFPVVCLGREF